MFDLILSVLLLILSPILLIISGAYRRNFSKLFSSLIGTRSIIGTKRTEENLPFLKEGVFDLAEIRSNQKTVSQLDYAKRHSILLDFEYLLLALRS